MMDRKMDELTDGLTFVIVESLLRLKRFVPVRILLSTEYVCILGTDKIW